MWVLLSIIGELWGHAEHAAFGRLSGDRMYGEYGMGLLIVYRRGMGGGWVGRSLKSSIVTPRCA